ncbi:MAG: hypothetical protein A6F70_02990 [Cycloclasticus sp. symbiont of Bathymodiolus heckerae]|nr:MAG: hypothetical protein A6F70_02990 [Cycloclasticus sp. symbiont of Bathymodiolus heckerae]
MHYALCPHCLSTLKITDEQLTLKSGLVRCSHCNDVFNACENRLPEQTEQRLTDRQTKQKKSTTDVLEAETAIWEKPTQETKSSVPFGFLSFVLAFTFVGQFIYTQPEYITQNVNFQPLLKQVNSAFGFNISNYENLDEIHIIERQLSPHSTLEDTLSLQLTMKNVALAEQSFPNIKLVLTSRSGEEIAYGMFTKYDYLQKNETNDFFKSQSLRQVNLLFKKPQQSISGFEISFSF